jgi:CHAT domain-containing protein
MAEARAEWLAKLPGRVLGSQTFADRVRGWSHSELTAAAGADETAAAIVTDVAAQHVNGALLDEIVESLMTRRLLGQDVNPVDVAVKSIGHYRGGFLPDPTWWSPTELNTGVLTAWSAAALGQATRAEVEALLAKRWDVSGAEQRSELLDGAASQEPPPIEQLGDDFAGDAAVVELWTSSAAAVESISDLAAPSAHLPALRQAIAMHWAIEDGEAAALQGSAFADELAARLAAWLRAVSVLEIVLATPSPAEDEPLRRLVELNRRQLYPAVIAPGIAVANGLPDRFLGHTLVADWLAAEVFSAGGRSGFTHHGPTAYLWLALESHELPIPGEAPTLGIGLLDAPRPPIELVVTIGDEDPAQMRYALGDSERSLGWLALLALSRRLLLDVFEIAADGLQLLRRVALPADDLVADIRPAIDALMPAAPQSFQIPSLDDHVLGGFAASENAKSELLLALLEARAPGAPGALRGTAETFLTAKMSQAWARYAGGDGAAQEAAVTAARQAFEVARSRQPGRAPVVGRDHAAELRDGVAGISTAARAVVHFNYREGHVEGFWVTDGGEQRGWLSLESLDLPALASAVEPWLHTQRGDVTALRAAARPIAEELHAAFADTAVTELLLVPWSLLHAVPFAALEIDDGLLLDRYRVAYAPSVSIVRRLLAADRPQRRTISLVAAHGGSLPWADAEVAAARLLQPDAQVVTDGSARADVVGALGGTRLLHVAGHGVWWADDQFASALDTRLEGVFDRYLSAAELLRDVDLSGTELVLLSACDTGRAPSLSHHVETYGGLDGALLAGGARAVVSTMWPVLDLAAMIFMTALHLELQAGGTVATAFETAVRRLRTEDLAALAPDDPLAAVLDAAARGWRAGVAQVDLSDPACWAPFRLSGAHWASHP